MSYENAPLYVTLGLYGLKTRKAAMIFVWISIALALVLPLLFEIYFGPLCLLAALWYWLAIKWMDANDGWNSK